MPTKCPASHGGFNRFNHGTDRKLRSVPGEPWRLSAYWKAHPPDIVFLPHGNDTNVGHRRTYGLFRQVVKMESRDVAALLNRDPKTVAMREDAYTVFGEEEARWKAELLRFHRSQHERNLRTRGHGFDERILRLNRQTGMELGRGGEYAEVFELELHPGVDGGN